MIIIILDQTRKETILPNPPTLFQFTVKIPGINLICQTDAARQRVFFLGHSQQMDMVVHQAVSPYLQRKFTGVFEEQLQIGLTILIVKKSGGTVVASLRDVMGISGSDDSGDSRHVDSVGQN